MKVLILTAVPFPNGMAPTNRIKCYAKALISQQVDCEVVCFRRSDIATNVVARGVCEGVPFRYIGKNSLRSKNKYIGRLEDIIDHFNLLFFLLFNVTKNTIVFSYGSTLYYGNILITVTHLKRGIFVRDLVEIPNVTDNDTPKQKKIRELELSKQFPRYDGVIAISEALEKLSVKYMSKSNAVLKVPILVDYEKYCLEDTSDLSEKLYIFHSGTLTEQKDGFAGMIEAFGIATSKMDRPIYFYSTGNLSKSKNETQIKELINRYRIEDKVKFLGYLSDEELRNYIKGASLVIINKYKTEQNIYCFSTKLGEYMAAGKPVIITNVGEAMNWLTDQKDSYIVEPENAQNLSEAILTLLSDDILRKKIANNGRITCKKSFDYHNYGKTLVDFFKSLQK